MRRKYFPVLLLIALGSCCSKCQVNRTAFESPVSQDLITKGEDSVVVKAGEQYVAGEFKEALLGAHYRDVWNAPVKVRILNLNPDSGGYEIHAKSGGQQTYSLDLRDSVGRHYVARSLQKDPRGALSPGFKTGVVRNFIQDQISATNPYAALMVPRLAKAAGIYHSTPELVYIIDSPQLGELNQYFNGVLALLEQDADENWENREEFGNTKNAVGTEKMLESINEGVNHSVDARAYLRARLFDMWIGDWDRHDGQWRWATIETDTETVYRPIPEDRDNMMFRTDGAVPWIASRKWAARKFQDFKDTEVRDIEGLNQNGRPLDERLLGELGKSTWLEIAQDLQNRLTDEVISASLQAMPDTVVKLVGEETARVLRERRKNLTDYASRYYNILAEEVQVHGTEKKDRFIIKKTNDNLNVTVISPAQNGKVRFHRLFLEEETDGIKLYPHSEDDEIDSPSESEIEIKIVAPGEEEDFLDD